MERADRRRFLEAAGIMPSKSGRCVETFILTGWNRVTQAGPSTEYLELLAGRLQWSYRPV